MGHSSMRAALIYQHATRERDRTIADRHSEQIKIAGLRRPSARGRGGRVRNGHGERERCLISVTRPSVPAGHNVVGDEGNRTLTLALQMWIRSMARQRPTETVGLDRPLLTATRWSEWHGCGTPTAEDGPVAAKDVRSGG